MVTQPTITNNKLRTFFKKYSLVAVFFAGFCLSPLTAQAFDIHMGTGLEGTFSHFAGRTLCRIMNSHLADVHCQVVPTIDGVDNLTNIRSGSLDIGLVDSQMVVDAVKKAGRFEFLDIGYENIRVISPIYDMPVSLVVRGDAKIASLAELKGKRLNAGTPGSAGAQAVNAILAVKGWSKEDFSLLGDLPPSQSQDTMAFCHGTMQAMIHVGVHPNPSFQQLFKLCGARLIALEDAEIVKLIESNEAIWKSNINANAYSQIAENVPTFATRAMLVTSEDLDDETVGQILDAIKSNQERLANAHSALSLFGTLSGPMDMAGVPLHPGAEKYYSNN